MNDEKNIVVDLKDISKSFGSNKVLDNVNFTLHEGEVHALLGENGAGKTTLMNILYGLYEPTSGSVTVKGKTFDIMSSLNFCDNICLQLKNLIKIYRFSFDNVNVVIV